MSGERVLNMSDSTLEDSALKLAAIPLYFKSKPFEMMIEDYPIPPKGDCNMCSVCLQRRYDRANEKTPLIEKKVVEDSKPKRNFHEKILVVFFVLLILFGIVIIITTNLIEDESNIIEEFDYVSKYDWTKNMTYLKNLPNTRLPISRVSLLELTCIKYTEFENADRKKIKLVGKVLYNFYQREDGKMFEGRGFGYQSVCDDGRSCDKTVTIALLEASKYPPSLTRILKLKAFLNFAISNNILKNCFQVIVQHSDNRYLDDIASVLDDIVEKDSSCKYDQ